MGLYIASALLSVKSHLDLDDLLGGLKNFALAKS